MEKKFLNLYPLQKDCVRFSNFFLGVAPLVVALQFGLVARAAELQVIERHLPEAAANLTPIGRLPNTTRLNLAIGLPLRNQAALLNLLQQINDPASPNYHRYLTPEQFTEQFGPPPADYQAVIAFAKQNGLKVIAEHPNRMLLDLSGTVADVERALHMTMRTYRHPTENRTFFAPDTRPALDLATPILSISGLNNYSLPKPRLTKKLLAAGRSALPNSGSGPGGTYMGNDFHAAYAPDSTLNGSGQIVGLLQFDGYTASDITYYVSQAGLPSPTLSNVLLDGFDGNPTGSGGEVEVSLDIEMTMSMATNLSKVIVYEAGPSGNWHDLLNRMATDNLAKQLSCSWYIPGGGSDPVADQIWEEMAAQGQSFFSASGDDDAYTGLIDFPSDTPYITQVGGTTLTTSSPGGSWVSETVWNWGNGSGSGGGISTSYSIPTWQTNVSMTTNQGSTTKRNTPDVALTANQVYVRADGQDYDVGGTSCAAPLWAAFTALVNQQAAAAGQPTVGFINPAVYAIGAGGNYLSAFHDITTGNNQRPGSGAKFSAVGGYDLCTGWGTPAGQNLINALANPEALQITPSSGFASSGGVGGPFTFASQIFSLTNSGTNSLTWTLAYMSAWLKVSPMGGTLNAGGAAATVTASLNAAASNLVTGIYSATVWFTNLNDNFGQSRQFGLSVISPPAITVQPISHGALEGGTTVFMVSATGGLPLFYQWQVNGTNLTDEGNISGTATTNLIISNISAANIGIYSVVVTNAAGAVTSSNAPLFIVQSRPVITMQPSSQTTVLSETTVFTVKASGTAPLSYQWSFDGTNLVSATNQILTLPNVQLVQAGSYAVVVTNIFGFAASSNAALTVLTSFPLLDVDFGDDGGGGVSPKTGYAAIGLATNDFWNFYDRSISPGVWRTSGALVNLNTAVGLATTVGMSVSDAPGAYGNGSSDPMYGVYIYPFSGDNVVTFTNLPAGQYDVLAYSQDGNYELTVGGTSYGVKTTADPAPGGVPVWTEGVQYARFRNVTVGAGQPLALTVRDGVSGYAILAGMQILGSVPTPPVITSQPTNQTIYAGQTASFSVTASGTAPLSYQWSFNTTNLAGATNATLILPGVQLAQTGNYAVTVTNIYGSAASSNAALTVNDKLDHFAWSQIPTPRFVNVPFNVEIQALDATNGVFTNFTGTVVLSSTNGISVNPPISATFAQGIWAGLVTIPQQATNLVLQAVDGTGEFGVANAIDIVNLPTLGLMVSGNFMLIYWPITSSNFVLESSGSLSPAQWVPVTSVPFQIGDQYLQSIPIGDTNQFYRLQYTLP